MQRVRALSRGLFALVAAAGCAGEPDQGATSLSMQLVIPPTVGAITSVNLVVYDDLASCDGPDVVQGGASALMTRNVALGQTVHLEVPAGERTFAVNAYDQANLVARGCTTATLVLGRTNQVAIQLEAYVFDAGPPDAPPPPPNDSCAAPAALAAGVVTAGSTRHGNDDLQGSCADAGRTDVVYSFVVAAPSRATVTITGAETPMTASLRSTCDDATSEIACADPVTSGDTTLTTGALPAGTYFVVVEAQGAAEGDFSIQVSLEAVTAPPANDTCASPEALVPGTDTAGTLVDAFDDTAGSCGGAGGADVFYTLTLDASYRVEIQVTGQGTLDPLVYLRDTCSSPSPEAGCANDTADLGEWLGVRELGAGTYTIVVDAAAGADAFTIRADLLPPPPANDLCAGATALVEGTPVTGATVDANDDLELACGLPGGADLFYSFTLAEPRQVTLSLADLAGEHAVALYQPPCAAPTDLDCAGSVGLGETLFAPNLPAGNYLVVVEDTIGTGGQFELTLTTDVAIPPADECWTAATLIPGTTSGDLAGADGDDAGSCSATTGVDQVYELSLPVDRRVTLTSAAGFPHTIHMRSACGDPATEIGCNTVIAPAGGSATIDIGNLAAGTYYAWFDRNDATSGGTYQLTLAYTTPLLPPANDLCGAATNLPTGMTAGTLLHATDDPVASPTCAPAGNADVFYTFTLTQHRRVRITATATASAFDPVLALRAGCEPDTELACANGSALGSETLEVLDLGPGTYTVAVDAASGSPGGFSLLLELLDPPPANDSCAGATPLTAGTPLTGQIIAGAADNEAGSGSCAAPSAVDVVYTFTTSAEQRARVTVTPTGFNTAVYLRGPDCPATTGQIACANAATGTETIDVASLPAGTYHVVVERVSGTGSTFDIGLELLPSADSCASPVTLLDGVPLASSTAGGRADDAAGSCGGAGGTDAVFTFSLATTRRVELDVTSGFDHLVYLRKDACATGTEVRCDDNTVGSPDIDVLYATPGVYYVFVDSAVGEGGDFTINLTLGTAVPPPSNDTCTTPGTFPVTGTPTLWGANDDYAATCNTGGGVDMVYGFTLTQRSRVVLSAVSTGDVAVWLSSSPCAGGAELACANAGTTGTESITVEDLPAGTYYAFVEGAGGFAGSVTPTLTISAPPGNDLCTGATTLSSGVTLSGQTLAVADDTTSGSCAAAGLSRDVFYTFALATRSVVDLAVTGATVDTTLALQTTCGDPLTEEACSAATSPGETARFLDLEAGSYTVVVDGPGDATASGFSILYTATAVPDNNSCVAPAPVTSGATLTGTLVGATGELTGSCGGGTGGDVVYTFTLAGSARVRATATRTSGSFNPVLYLRSDCLAAGSEPAGGCSNASSGGTETLDIPSLSAGTYYLVVDSAGGTAGTFNLLVEELPIPPDNDLCDAPATLVDGTAASGTTYGSRDETTGSCSTGGSEVFYTFTLATPRRVVLGLSGATVQHALYLQGTCGSAASQLACASTPALDETIDLANLAAGTYTVVVESLAAGGGTFGLLLQTYQPVVNDTCASPAALTSGTPRVGDTSIGAHDDELSSCAAGATDILYSYTLAEAQRVNLQVATSYDAAVAIRSATCTSEASEISCVDTVAGAGTEPIEIRNQPAGTYFVVVEGVGGGAGSADVSLVTSMPPPAGDWCPEVATLTAAGTYFTQALNSFYADDTAGTCGGAGGRDRVYSFNIAGPQHVTVTTQGNFAHHLYVRSAACATGAEIACATSTGSGAQTGQVDFPNLAAGTYFVIVDAASASATGSFDLTLAISPPLVPPGNDACAGAYSLASGVTRAGDTIVNAADDSDGTCSAAGTTRDSFYTFSLAGRSVVDLVVANTSINTSVALQTTCGDAATQVGCSAATSPGETARFVDLPAGTYSVLVDGPGDGSAATYDITYTAQLVPDNNSCVAPATLTPGTGATGTLVSATGEYSGSCGGAGADVVYAFTLAATARVRATVTRTSGTFDPVVYLRGACATAGSEPAGGCVNAGTGGSEVLDLDSLAPGTYYLVVDSAGGTAGTFSVLVESLPVPPLNDRCAGAIGLTDGVLESGTTVASRDDTTGSCAAGGVEVFYTFTLASPRRVVLDLAPAAIGHAIYLQGTCGSAATQVACTSTGSLNETLDLPILAAGTYTVVVEADGATGDSFDLLLSTYAPVVNDTCSTAITLASGTPRLGDTSVGAADNETATCAGAGTTPDIVYAYTLTEARRVNLSVNPTYDAAVSVRSATCTSEMAETVCQNGTTGTGAETIDIRTQAAGTYYVILDGVAGGSGTADVSLTTSSPPPPGDWCPEIMNLATGVSLNQAISSLYADDTSSTCGGAGDRDRVYTFTIGTPQRVTVTTTSSSAHILSMNAGACGAWSESGCQTAAGGGTKTATLDFLNLAAGTYFVVVENTTTGNITFDITLNIASPVIPPGNDTCSGAYALTSGAKRTGDSLVNSNDDSDGTCAAVGVTRDVFYTFTLGSRSVVDVVVDNTSINTSLAVQATCGSSASEAGCLAATSPGENGRFLDLPGGTYTLLVDGPGDGSASTFDILMNAQAVPDNNSCVAPATLTPGTAATGTLVSATNEYAGTCGGGLNGEVVYTFTLSAAQRVRTTVTRTGGTFDPLLYIRSACGTSTSEVAGGCGNAASGATETLDIDSLPAGTYYLVVDSAGGTAGTFNVLVETLPVPPANDRCPGAATLTDGVTVSGTTAAARDDTTGSCSLGGVEVFYTFTLATPRRVVLSLSNTTIQQALYVQGTCGSAASQLACASTGSLGETIDLPSLAAGTYTVVVEAEGATGSGFDLRLDTYQELPNDTCTTPITLVDGVPRVGDTLVGAADNESSSCGGGSTADVVYRYTLATARRVNLQVSSTIDAAVSVRSATCTDEGSEVTCANALVGAGAEGIDLRNQAAGTYYVVVEGVGGATGTFDISLTTSAPPPPGDYCPEVMTLSTGTSLNQAISSTFADDASASCAGAGSRDRVYQFTTSSPQRVTITTQSAATHAIYVRSASCATGSEVGCQVAAGAATKTASLDFLNLAAGTYFVFVENTSAGDMTFDITLNIAAPVVPPGNDTCSGAYSLVSGVKRAADTIVNANDDGDGTCAAVGTTRDVFYTFTLASRSVVDVVLDNTSVNLSVAAQATCGSAASEAGCLAATSPGENGRFLDLPGGTYSLLVDGPGDGSAGSYDILLTSQTVPDNNSCVAPATLTPGVATGGTLVSATNEYAGSCAGGLAGEVVYAFTLGSAQRVRATVTRTGGSFDPVLYLRSACATAGSEAACANASTGATETLDVDSLAAGTYYLVVDSAGGTAGTFSVLVETLPVPPLNDRCTGAVGLTDGVLESGTTYASRDDTTGSCSTGGIEVFYTFTLATPRRVVLDLGNTAAQHAVYLQATCGSAASQVACVSTGSLNETLELPYLAAGTYTVVVESTEAVGNTFDLLLQTYQPVPNDTCASPTTLLAGSPLTAETTVGSTDDESATCGGAGVTPDVVYSYTLSAARRVNLSVTSAFDAAVSIRSPMCGTETDELLCQNTVAAAGTEAIEVRNQPAGTYYVVVDGVDAATGSFDVALATTTPPPAGDYCPEVVNISSGTITAQSLGSTYANDTTGTCGGAGRDRVYSFTLSGSQHVTLTSQSATAHHMYLRSTSCETGTQLSCQTATGSGTLSASLDYPNLAAGTYYVFVDLANAADTATFDLTLSITAPVLPPANDTCAGAISLVDGILTAGTLTASNDDATLACVSGSNKDVYYKFTLPTAKRVIADLSSSVDTGLSLRSSCTAELACANSTVGAGGESIDHGYLAAGTYYLVVEGVAGSSGDISVRYATYDPRPINDGCAGAIALASGVARAGDSLNNSLDDADGSCGDLSSGDVAYTFTVPGPANARARINVSSASGFDPVLYVRAADCAAGAEVGCSQGRTTGTETLDLPNLAPGTYTVWVDAMGGVAAPGTFNILLELLTAVPPPSNDTCASPDTLVASTPETGSTIGATDDYALTCLTADGRDTVHQLTLASASALLVKLTPQAPTWNLAAALRAVADCATTTELSCVAGAFATRYINRPNLAAGTYSVVVDGNYGETGDYSIEYQTRAADSTFGYYTIDTTGNTYTPLTDGTPVTIPLTNWGVDANTGPGDEWSQAVTLPFDFPYFGATYSTITVTSNFYLTFLTADPAGYTNDCSMDTSVPNATIAPFWDDGITRTTYPSQLLTKTEGEAPYRRFILEYKNWDMVACGTSCYLIAAAVNHQVILYEDGDIEFRYGPRVDATVDRACSGNPGDGQQHIGGCATIGLENATGTDIDEIQCNTTTPPVIEGRVIRFVHPR